MSLSVNLPGHTDEGPTEDMGMDLLLRVEALIREIH